MLKHAKTQPAKKDIDSFEGMERPTIDWQVVLAMLAGLLSGLWLDSTGAFGDGHTWSLLLMLLGLVIGTAYSACHPNRTGH